MEEKEEPPRKKPRMSFNLNDFESYASEKIRHIFYKPKYRAGEYAENNGMVLRIEDYQLVDASRNEKLG